jgi:hypothetical protein
MSQSNNVKSVSGADRAAPKPGSSMAKESSSTEIPESFEEFLAMKRRRQALAQVQLLNKIKSMPEPIVLQTREPPAAASERLTNRDWISMILAAVHVGIAALACSIDLWQVRRFTFEQPFILYATAVANFNRSYATIVDHIAGEHQACSWPS